MNPYHRIIAGLWLVFVAYWTVAAMGAKRNASSRLWREGIGLRLIVIVVIAATLRSPSLREFLAQTQRSASIPISSSALKRRRPQHHVPDGYCASQSSLSLCGDLR